MTNLRTRQPAVLQDRAFAVPPASRPIHVLTVDSESSARRMIAQYLGDHDMRVTSLESGSRIDEVLARAEVDLLLLDLKLPGVDGMQIARRIRAKSALPIIMLAGRKDEADRVMGLELGADDYLTKPFSPRELLARIRALVRRCRMRETITDSLARIRGYRFAGWELNVRLRRLTCPSGDTVRLTNSDFNLLVAFLTAPGRVLSRDQLLDLSRLHNDEVYERSVDVQVGRRRRKIGANADGNPLIRTERGAGYLLAADVETVR
jgi:two-component system, OmpR family, response regulator